MVLKKELFTYFFIIFMLLGIVFIMVIYYYNQESLCRVSPLIYGANYYKENSGAEIVFGSLTLAGESGTESLIIMFNDEEKEIKRREGINPLS